MNLSRFGNSSWNFKKWIVSTFLRPEWRVIDDPNYADSPELVLVIWGVQIGLYKGAALFYTGYNTREPKKREFGESLHSQIH